MLGGQFGAFGGWSVCSGEGKKGPFLGVVNLERYRLVNLSVFSNNPPNNSKIKTKGFKPILTFSYLLKGEIGIS